MGGDRFGGLRRWQGGGGDGCVMKEPMSGPTEGCEVVVPGGCRGSFDCVGFSRWMEERGSNVEGEG